MGITARPKIMATLPDVSFEKRFNNEIFDIQKNPANLPMDCEPLGLRK
jgi:hypothetical protein